MNDIIISTADHTQQQSELAEALEQLKGWQQKSKFPAL